ncbi:Serine/threonine protein kinase [Giardia duodenalis]|uniref:Serine/threonine protein kinase n=1 Tax=Giardia intestinalis TaxID=5741 RepID=V6TSK1_GIAIN|nr:Serine/threonine protein kinase [Giardia intestinalis]
MPAPSSSQIATVCCITGSPASALVLCGAVPARGGCYDARAAPGSGVCREARDGACVMHKEERVGGALGGALPCRGPGQPPKQEGRAAVGEVGPPQAQLQGPLARLEDARPSSPIAAHSAPTASAVVAPSARETSASAPPGACTRRTWARRAGSVIRGGSFKDHASRTIPPPPPPFTVYSRPLRPASGPAAVRAPADAGRGTT